MLSKRTQYALKALGLLADKYQQGPVLIASIAKSKKIPVKFLESILLDLKHSGILGSQKGRGGGYYLIHDPHQTTIATVMRVIEGPIALLPCVSLNFYQRCMECDEKRCKLNKVMILVRDAMLGVLEKKTIADL